MSDIFLSYASADRDHLRPLVRALEDQGWSVFWDRKIPVGQTWRGVIGREITDCLCIVVVWTQKSVQSEWVMEEAEEGKNRRILFPVSLDGTPPPFGFGSIQSADFSNWEGSTDHSGYKLLIGELTRHIQEINDQQEAECLLNEKELKEQAAAEQRKQEEIERKQREDEQHRLAMEKEQQDKVAKERAEEEAKLEEERQAKLEEERQAKLEEDQDHQAKQQAEQQANEKTKQDVQKEEIEADVQAVVDNKHMDEDAQPSKPTSDSKKKVIGIFGAILVGAGGLFAYDYNAPGALAKFYYGVPNYTTTFSEPEMVKIPAGTFTMGCKSDRDEVEGGCYDDEKPAHKVTLKTFELAKYEVTVGEYFACVNDKVCKPPEWAEPSAGSYYWKMGKALTDEKHPIVGVSWNNAKEYIDWLNTNSDKQYRLPSETEWEYASRGGENTAYSWGNDIGNNNANCRGCGSEWDGEKTAPVGSFSANQYGLHDMHGNVEEWVQDCYHESYNKAPRNNRARELADCERRVLRGGSWFYLPRDLRSAFRHRYDPSFRDFSYGLGFRVARTP